MIREHLYRRTALAVALLLVPAAPCGSAPSSADPSAPGYSGRRGVTLHVSRLGDDSDGTSWTTAFRTIQKALLHVPDAEGGHVVAVRPDTYAEANLHPAFPGAAGSYNLLVGDHDGTLGSGATGWVVIDSGAPLAVVRTDPKAPTGNPTFMILPDGDPAQETGFKCVDWWGPWKCDPELSGVIWDRWIYLGDHRLRLEAGEAAPRGPRGLHAHGLQGLRLEERRGLLRAPGQGRGLRPVPPARARGLRAAPFLARGRVPDAAPAGDRTPGSAEGLIKLPVTLGPAMESTPVVFGGRTLLVLNQRDDAKNKTDAYTGSMRLLVRDLATGSDAARFGEGHSFASAFVEGGELSVFASEGTNFEWLQGIHRFSSTDLKAPAPSSASSCRTTTRSTSTPPSRATRAGSRSSPAPGTWPTGS
ncbi:MAG: hypothetical protein HY721_12745 [Planctomycetes bacterium]|nr:hypothetical protein [Planctomycetota bacterium]